MEKRSQNYIFRLIWIMKINYMNKLVQRLSMHGERDFFGFVLGMGVAD